MYPYTRAGRISYVVVPTARFSEKVAENVDLVVARCCTFVARRRIRSSHH
jgi:hypothetical protein